MTRAQLFEAMDEISKLRSKASAALNDAAHPPSPAVNVPPTDTLHGVSQDFLIPGGPALVSKNGRFTLVHQEDGNVVVYGGAAARWATGTNGASATFVLQRDGNVVLYDKANKALWASGTGGSAAKRLVLGDDGGLVLFGEGGARVWVGHA